MAKTLLTTTGVLAGAAAFLALNLLADRTLPGARMDLTQNGLYTVSEGALNVMRRLEEPVTLKLYYSSGTGTPLPFIRTFEQRVRGLLEEFTAESGGKLRLEVLDPEPFSETEDEAVAAGIEPKALATPGQVLYLGLLATGSTGEREVIAFIDPSKENSLEYDITRVIHKLGTTTRPSLTIVSALPLTGQPAMPWAGQQQGQDPFYVYEELQDFFDVRIVAASATELPKCDLLMVAHPKGISPELTYAIDQFVIHGGHALVMVDPFCQFDMPPPDPQNPMAGFEADHASSLPSLFAAWGLDMPGDSFVGDRTTALPQAWGERKQPIPFLQYHKLGPDNMNRDDVITSQLQGILLSTPGSLRKLEGGTTQLTPLLFSSSDAALIPTSQVQFMPDPQRMLSEFVPANMPFTIAARVHGTVKSAFPDGKPKPLDPAAAETAVPDPDFLAESQGPVNLIVVADADLLFDAFWVSRQQLFGQTLTMVRYDNGDFVRGALDNLSGSNDLISIRSRARVDRPFKVMQELQRDADQRFAATAKLLEDQLRETERKITELQSQKSDEGSLILSPEQQAEIERFEQERLATRKALREVQYSLNKDIEHLQTWIKVVNIGLVPALLCVLAVVTWSWRRQRRA